MKNRWIQESAILILVGLVISLIFMAFQRFSWLNLINSLSMISLVYIAIGAMAYVIYGGFFRGYIFSFKTFARSKGDHMAEELTKSENEFFYKEKKKETKKKGAESPYGIGKKRPPIIYAFLFVGIIFFIGTLAASLAYIN
ncbi:DUF3899 domain-containing protein [Camelliibacillus cellulosilyticus]|uniref:DUF3899 domain-containing protein n=1 Tax=Camelliibacillus cellulosilyticus TaxID=2174486 RepID=A0ABV9GPK4_9BACL